MAAEQETNVTTTPTNYPCAAAPPPHLPAAPNGLSASERDRERVGASSQVGSERDEWHCRAGTRVGRRRFWSRQSQSSCVGGRVCGWRAGRESVQ